MKLPEKYRFTGGVIGNGYPINLTDGTNTGQVASHSNQDLFVRTSSLANKNDLYFPTDPEKSGIVLETDEIAKTFIAY